MEAFLTCQALLEALHALPSLILPAPSWVPPLSVPYREHQGHCHGLVLKSLFPSRPEGHLVQLSKGESQDSTEKGRVLVSVLVAMTKYLTGANEMLSG